MLNMATTEDKRKKYLFSEDETEASKVKSCIFCAETIQTNAVKCRFCGEFLNTDKAKALQASQQENENGEEQTEEDSHILFAARPSFLGMISSAIKGCILLTIAVILAKYPLEDKISVSLERVFGYQLSDGQYFALAEYLQIVSIGIFIIVVLVLAYKALNLKMTRYEVSIDRIEWSRGILDKRVDNIDMFRVVYLKFRRSLLDCLFGIGTVGLITTDKTDPKFEFKKVRNSRKLYDVIKKASLEADQKQRVVHIE